MRERLTASFIVLSILLLLGAGFVRSFILRDLIREQEGVHVQQEVVLVAKVVNDRQEEGGAVDRDFLAGLVDDDGRLVYTPRTAEPVVVTGEAYDSADPDDDLAATAAVTGGAVTVGQSPTVLRDVAGRDMGSVVVTFLMIGALAGLIGFIISSRLSAPFRQLAAAAAALGRGRFDLDLPDTRIPEARAIAQALGTSAGQLEDRLRRERDFTQHASHVLRTPLTRLRLELEDLTLRDDVAPDVQEAAHHGIDSVDEMNAVVGELVDISRSGSLVAGAELPLLDLARQLAQRWADRLAVRDRTLTASAEGDLTLSYTPGPVEHVLDLVLAEVVRRGTGAVRIVFQGEPSGYLRVQVSSAGPVPAADDPGASTVETPDDRIEQARSVVAALGGRLVGGDPAQGIEVLLPRR
jgi:signal transduction histidine kinase